MQSSNKYSTKSNYPQKILIAQSEQGTVKSDTISEHQRRNYQMKNNH